MITVEVFIPNLKNNISIYMDFIGMLDVTGINEASKIKPNENLNLKINKLINVFKLIFFFSGIYIQEEFIDGQSGLTPLPFHKVVKKIFKALETMSCDFFKMFIKQNFYKIF